MSRAVAIDVAHRTFERHAAEQLAGDSRVVAAFVSGSRGGRAGDAWADIDVHVLADDAVSHEVLATPAGAEHYGDLVLWVDCSFNAPAGGTMAFARYLVDGELVLVDWHVWPARMACLPTGSRLVYQRADCPALAPFDGTTVDRLVTEERRRVPPWSKQQRIEWETCLVHIATAFPVRGHDPSRMLELIGAAAVPPDDRRGQLSVLRHHVESRRPWLTPRAIDATLGRLAAAESSVS